MLLADKPILRSQLCCSIPCSIPTAVANHSVWAVLGFNDWMFRLVWFWCQPGVVYGRSEPICGHGINHQSLQISRNGKGTNLHEGNVCLPSRSISSRVNNLEMLQECCRRSSFRYLSAWSFKMFSGHCPKGPKIARWQGSLFLGAPTQHCLQGIQLAAPAGQRCAEKSRPRPHLNTFALPVS